MTKLTPRRCLLALAALLTPDPAAANDRDVKALQIPASSCAPDHTIGHGRVNPTMALYPYSDSMGMQAYCPLPLNNTDLGGATNDNDMSSFTVYYEDLDARGTIFGITVKLIELKIVNGALQHSVRCSWASNQTGPITNSYTNHTVPCVVDLSPTSFYQFDVSIYANISDFNEVSVDFVGIRFP